MNDGDLGLFGLSSPSPPHSSEQHSASESPQPSSPPFAHDHFSSAHPSPSSVSSAPRRLGRQDPPSSSSLFSNYYSAEENNNNLSPSPSSSQLSTVASESLSQAPTVTDFKNSRESVPLTPTLASRSRAISVEEESDISPPPSSSPRQRPSKRSSRFRAALPPVEDRLPVGAGGPPAPPRTASRKTTMATSTSTSSYPNGDLGSELMPGTSGQIPLVGSPVLPNPSPSIASIANMASAPTSGAPLQASLSSPVQGIDSKATSLSTSQATPSQRPLPKLNREELQRWVLSVGCVNFDLELGPDLEFLYPPLGISREERDNIAFSSFPDTSIFDDGYSVFSWRVREVPLDSSGSEPPTIKSLSSPTTPADELDDKTPRPSFNQGLAAATPPIQTKVPSPTGTEPTSPVSPATSTFLDAPSASSSSSSKPVSRHGSDANLKGSSSPTSPTFHERLASKLFPGGHHSQSASTGSSTSSVASGTFRHKRKGSATSSVSTNTAPSTPAAVEQQEFELAADQAQASPAAPATTSSKNTALANLPRQAGNSTSSSYIYGYVFFRQKRDPSNRRGYFQKSVVILSHLPYVGLFSQVVARLGPLYFEHGMTMLEAFANDVVNWPSPQPGSILTLPLLGSILTAAIPFGQQAQNSPNADRADGRLPPTATMTIRHRSRSNQGNIRELPEPLIGPEGPLLASIPSTSLFDTFKEALADMWLLWECVLLAEPILVIGPDPKVVSEAVWHMLDLIRPIPFAGDFRPYFHIHDYDFRTLVTKNKPQAGTLIGATNPFFATACSHWPHVLRVGKAATKIGSGFKHGQSASSSKKSGPIGGGVGGGHGAGGGGPDHIPGFTTKRKRRISKDRPLLKRLTELAAERNKSTEQETASANVMMRRYFADLTERFLAPLNRYVASLVPADFDLSSPSEAPKIKPFNTPAFLASLKAHGTPLSIRSRSLPTGATVRQSLYLDFLKCPNFSLWLHSRVAAAEEEQRRRYIAALVQGDVTAFGHSRGEIETIDLYSRLVEEIRLVDVQLTAPTEPGPGSRWRTDKPGGHAAKSSAASAGAASGSGRSTPVNGATSWPTTEKRLLDQKTQLIAQLDKLCLTLPDDLRNSLRRPA